MRIHVREPEERLEGVAVALPQLVRLESRLATRAGARAGRDRDRRGGRVEGRVLERSVHGSKVEAVGARARGRADLPADRVGHAVRVPKVVPLARRGRGVVVHVEGGVQRVRRADFARTEVVAEDAQKHAGEDSTVYGTHGACLARRMVDAAPSSGAKHGKRMSNISDIE